MTKARKAKDAEVHPSIDRGLLALAALCGCEFVPASSVFPREVQSILPEQNDTQLAVPKLSDFYAPRE